MRTASHYVDATARPAASELVFDDGICVQCTSQGFFWRWKGATVLHGPFETLREALHDVDDPARADRIGACVRGSDDIGYEAAFPVRTRA
jgi:hypothetical protein